MAGGLVLYYGAENYEQLANNLLSGNIAMPVLKTMQVVSSVFIFALPVFIYAYLNQEKTFASNGLNALPKIDLLALVVPITLLSLPFIAAMLAYNQGIKLPSYFSHLEQYLKDSESSNESLIKKLLVMNNGFDLAVNVFVIAIVPALVEELFFRGCLQRILTSLYNNVHVGIIITAIIFSFIHFQFYGFLPRMILGILFGYLFVWTNNLWYSIFAHFINNGLQVLMVYLYQQKLTNMNIEDNTAPSMLITLACTGLLFYVLSIFYKKSGTTL